MKGDVPVVPVRDAQKLRNETFCPSFHCHHPFIFTQVLLLRRKKSIGNLPLCKLPPPYRVLLRRKQSQALWQVFKRAQFARVPQADVATYPERELWGPLSVSTSTSCNPGLGLLVGLILTDLSNPSGWPHPPHPHSQGTSRP